MKCRWRWPVLIVAIFVVSGVGLSVVRSPNFQKWYNPPVLLVPADDEVVELRASMRASQVFFEPIPEFVVPPEHVPAVLGWLRPLEYVSDPPIYPEHDELGEIVIRAARSGQELRLRFYWAGKNPAVVTRDGMDHFWGRGVDDQGRPRDGGSCLGNAIREANKAAKR
jgi:hypothetical protein